MVCKNCGTTEADTWYTLTFVDKGVGVFVQMFCSSACIKEDMKFA